MTLSVERVRRRAPVVKAVYFYENAEEVADWCGGTAVSDIRVRVSRDRVAKAGQWIVREESGTYTIVDRTRFEVEYDSPPELETAETSGLVAHAERELDLIGMSDESDDALAKLGRQGVLDLVRLFASQGHSGSSANWMLNAVATLLQFKPLTALTDDPEEWMVISEAVEEDGGHPLIWQNRRNPEAFSETAGRTYYLLSERAGVEPGKPTPLHTSKEHAGVDSQG